MKRLFISAFALLPAATFAQIPADVSLEPVPDVSQLNGPLGLKHAGDGSDRIFIIEQGGTIRVIDGDGTLLTTPFINLGSLVTANANERGLLDIAFHPEFALNGLFYLHYSAGTDRPSGTEVGDTIVAEFSITADPNVANNTPDRIILTVAQDFSNHNGGQMRFGPDGYLYLGLGDGGSGGDPCNRAQTLDPDNITTGGGCGADTSVALLGKMLRVDVDDTTPPGANNLCASNADGSANYAVPVENPFAGDSETGRCGEILLYGLRNPWRWSFDRLTEDLWIGDVGQGTTEEIDLLEWPLAGGDNLGWNVCEGSTLTGPSTAPCSIPDSITPVIEYANSGGNCSVTGGYRYRGPINSLRGRYIFGDFCSGRIWFADNASGSWQAELFTAVGFGLRSFGEDEGGNVYVIAGGDLFRFEGETDFIFADGFEQQ